MAQRQGSQRAFLGRTASRGREISGLVGRPTWIGEGLPTEDTGDSENNAVGRRRFLTTKHTKYTKRGEARQRRHAGRRERLPAGGLRGGRFSARPPASARGVSVGGIAGGGGGGGEEAAGERLGALLLFGQTTGGGGDVELV